MAGSIEAASLIGGCNASCVIGPISPFPDVREKNEKMRRTTIREYYATREAPFQSLATRLQIFEIFQKRITLMGTSF